MSILSLFGILTALVSIVKWSMNQLQFQYLFLESVATIVNILGKFICDNEINRSWDTNSSFTEALVNERTLSQFKNLV